MISLCVMVTSVDVIATRASVSVIIFFEKPTGDTKPRWGSFDSGIWVDRKWKVGGRAVFFVQHVSLLLVKVDVGVSKGFDDRVIRLGAGHIRGAGDLLNKIGSPTLVWANPGDGAGAGDRATEERNEILVAAPGSADENPIAPVGPQRFPTFGGHKPQDPLTKFAIPSVEDRPCILW